jgi:hypothetical protein
MKTKHRVESTPIITSGRKCRDQSSGTSSKDKKNPRVGTRAECCMENTSAVSASKKATGMADMQSSTFFISFQSPSKSGSGAVNGGLAFRMARFGSSQIPGNEAIEVVAVRSVSTEGLLIKQTFDATTEANLIRVILEANRPTHLAMPATAEDHYSSRSQPSSNHTQRPQPTRLLFLFTHLPLPVSPSKS